MHKFSHRVNAGRPPQSSHTQPKDLKGQRYGALRVIEFTHCRAGKAYWSCVCDCGGPGSQLIVRSDKLASGQTRACKCRTGYKKPGVAVGTKMPRQPKPAPSAPIPDPVTSRESLPVQVPPPTADPIRPARPQYTLEQLAAAELLSARQMRLWKFPWQDIAAYLALSRPGGCTIAQAQQITALPQTAAA